MRSIRLLGAFALCFAGLASWTARADQWRALVLLKSKTLPEIEFTDTTPTVTFARVDLKGRFKRPGWGLVANGGTQYLPSTAADRAFSFRILLTGPDTRVVLTAVGPEGRQESQVVWLRVKDWEGIRLNREKMVASHPFVQASLGVSEVSYRQQGFPDLGMIGLSAKISYVRPLFPPRWDIGVNFFGTVLPVYYSRPGVSVRYFGANLRIGYVPPFLTDPWRLGLFTGLSFSTMFTSGASVGGYQNELSAQLYPAFSRRLPGGNVLYTYLKYVPLHTHDELTQRELGWGIGFQHPTNSDHPLLFSLDISDFRDRFIADGTYLISTSYTLSVGYGF